MAVDGSGFKWCMFSCSGPKGGHIVEQSLRDGFTGMLLKFLDYLSH